MIDPEDTVVDLEEARAARRLGEALDGKSDADGEVLEALRVAAQVQATARPELSDARRDALADSLFGSEAKRPNHRRSALALVALVALVAGGGLTVFTQRPARAPAIAGELRGQANALVASLLPAPTAAERADRIAAAARPRPDEPGGPR